MTAGAAAYVVPPDWLAVVELVQVSILSRFFSDVTLRIFFRDIITRRFVEGRPLPYERRGVERL